MCKTKSVSDSSLIIFNQIFSASLSALFPEVWNMVEKKEKQVPGSPTKHMGLNFERHFRTLLKSLYNIGLINTKQHSYVEKKQYILYIWSCISRIALKCVFCNSPHSPPIQRQNMSSIGRTLMCVTYTKPRTCFSQYIRIQIDCMHGVWNKGLSGMPPTEDTYELPDLRRVLCVPVRNRLIYKAVMSKLLILRIYFT